MAPKVIDYSETCFYKICCKDLEIANVYVGHTTNFKCRKSNHMRNCNTETRPHYNQYVYKFIRENGGWNNFDMILIERIRCDDKLDALRKEGEYVELLNARLNCQIPSRTIKQWVEDNKERYTQLQQEYRENNRDWIKAYFEANKDKLKVKKKQYYTDHKETLKEKRKPYLEANKEHIKEQTKEYREANKEHLNECTTSLG